MSKHDHKWQLAKFVDEYESMTLFEQATAIDTKKLYSLWLCECGAVMNIDYTVPQMKITESEITPNLITAQFNSKGENDE